MLFKQGTVFLSTGNATKYLSSIGRCPELHYWTRSKAVSQGSSQSTNTQEKESHIKCASVSSDHPISSRQSLRQLIKRGIGRNAHRKEGPWKPEYKAQFCQGLDPPIWISKHDQKSSFSSFSSFCSFTWVQQTFITHLLCAKHCGLIHCAEEQDLAMVSWFNHLNIPIDQTWHINLVNLMCVCMCMCMLMHTHICV